MSDTQNQIGYDGPQHIDGVQPLPGMVPDISKVMPPQDVMDAAMLLSEACLSWTPTPLPKFDINALPTEPVVHNQSYLMHQDLCSLATDPVGFKANLNDIFGYGALAAVLAMMLLWLVFKTFSWLSGLFRKQSQRSAEALKARLIVEAAKMKLDATDKRRITEAAE